MLWFTGLGTELLTLPPFSLCKFLISGIYLSQKQNFSYFIQFVAYYFGTIYVYNGRLNGGQVVRVLFSVFFASHNLKEAGNDMAEISISIVSAKRIVRWLHKV